MHLEFRHDLDTVILRPDGPFTVEAALGWAPALLEVPEFRLGMHQVYDLSAVRSEGIGTRELEAVIDGLKDRTPRTDALVAYVASGDLGFGLARMFDALAGLSVPRVRGVFRSVDEALDWIRETQRARKTG